MLINKKSPHGGDIYTNPAEYDFSVNINPFGMPDKVKKALHEAVEECTAYPDPYCSSLREKISQYEGIPCDSIICSNGAAELIYQFAYSLPARKRALIVSPTFCEYGAALGAAGIGRDHYILERRCGFNLNEKILSAINDSYSALFICSPNNPTGITVDRTLLYTVAEKCKSSGIRLFCDFCFLDMSDDPGKYEIPAFVAQFPNVFVLKAFTKSYGMAGLRLGYGFCSDADFISRMSSKTQCWNVSVPAQKAGIAALECADYVADSARLLRAERERMKKKLESFNVEVFCSEANYLLMKSGINLPAELAARKILVRDCKNYVGLCSGYIRTAIKTREENDILLSAIGEIINGKNS